MMGVVVVGFQCICLDFLVEVVVVVKGCWWVWIFWLWLWVSCALVWIFCVAVSGVDSGGFWACRWWWWSWVWVCGFHILHVESRK